MIMIEAIVQVKPEKAALYEKAFLDLRALVHEKEPGTPFFELCKDLDDQCTYHVFEAYTDDAARAAHAATDYYLEAANIFLDCIAGDHMAEAARRGLTDPFAIYPLAGSSLKLLVYETV